MDIHTNLLAIQIQLVISLAAIFAIMNLQTERIIEAIEELKKEVKYVF